MLPSDVMTPWHYLVAAHEGDRHRDEARRHAHRRAILEARSTPPALSARPAPSASRLGPARTPRRSPLAWLQAAAADLRGQDHGLTDYPCRLPDGTLGRVSVVEVAGEWTMVCRVSRDAWTAGEPVVQDAA
jgi:hypothetical protein